MDSCDVKNSRTFVAEILRNDRFLDNYVSVIRLISKASGNHLAAWQAMAPWSKGEIDVNGQIIDGN